MGEITELVAAISRDERCIVLPPSGQPVVPGRRTPDDLREFYTICGGINLFQDSNYSWAISSPDHLAPTNVEVIGDQVNDDITTTWYIVARDSGDSSALISIDLGDDRLGWCYDSDVEVHGVAGSCAVISHSFAELLRALYAARGDYLFWGAPDFIGLGDAYD